MAASMLRSRQVETDRGQKVKRLQQQRTEGEIRSTYQKDAVIRFVCCVCK